MSQRPSLDEIDTRRKHAEKQLQKAEDQAGRQETDLAEQQKKLDQLNLDLELATEAADKYRDEQKKAAQEKGISLSSGDLAEYNKL